MSQQSSPTPDPVAWMVADSQGTPRSVRLLESNARYDAMQVKGANVVPLGPIASSALPATTPSDTPLPKWWEAAGFVGPFTPTGEGGNDGFVRDANGDVVANCFGFEARADVIAALLNSVRVSPSEGSAPDRPTGFRCSFCRKQKEAVQHMVASGTAAVQICDECVQLCIGLMGLRESPPSAPDTKPDERLAEIRERLAGISPTPWEHVGYFNAMRHIAGCGQTDDNVPHYVVRREGSSLKPNGARADAEFIAHAPEDIAYLLGRVSSSPPEGEDTQRNG